MEPEEYIHKLHRRIEKALERASHAGGMIAEPNCKQRSRGYWANIEERQLARVDRLVAKLNKFLGELR